ncbi:hypothetical protein PQC06_gp020 [Aeromonas phage LAh10]|uniref:Uncharacterized protein n=1 Tax=Aeromonas phage LAh10 TaxID=2591025 RepID=A0A514A1G7_9CAUD|nr:hypothetical protein PQC06_gp020 [Aeromonas phage LAh10]QDH47085.1 hypothetical protein LAh10_20 [Aeromonas phage LAh10]
MPNINATLEIAMREMHCGFVVDGNESYLTDMFSTTKTAIFSAVKQGAGKASESLVRALRNADQALLKAIGARRLLLSTMVNRANRDGVKEEITFPAGLLSRTTVKGYPGDIVKSIEVLMEAIKQVADYEQDLEGFYEKQLALLKSITKIKDTKEAAELITKLDDMKRPAPKFPDSVNSMSKRTKLLPGGRDFAYNSETDRFSIGNSDVDAKDETTSFAKEDMIRILAMLNKLIETYTSISKANERYAKHVSEFNTVVGKSFSHLEGLKGSVSATLLNDLSGRLNGDASTFAFYTGFLPKVVLVVDNHVEELTSFLSKHFN